MGVRALRGVTTALVWSAMAAVALVAACSGGSSPLMPAARDAATDAAASDGGAPPDASNESDGEATIGDAGDAAADVDASGCAVVGGSGEPLDLRCTGLYGDWASKSVAPGVEPYAPGFVMWTDGATSQRWIALPSGAQIDTSHMDDWTFPVGTRLWQELRLPLGDGSAPLRIETRFLWKQQPGSWVRATYRWSADGETSATEPSGPEYGVGGTSYEVPAPFECDECHNGRADRVLGFDAVSLSAPGASGLTMQQLVSRGLLTAPPSAPPSVPGNATEAAALGWLHANCGTACHNASHGSAGTSGLLLRLDVATLGSVQSTDAYTTGWNVVTSSFQVPDASTTYRIHACDPSSSAAYYRAAVRDGQGGVATGTQMPNVLTHSVDAADLAAFAAWMDEGCDAGDGG